MPKTEELIFVWLSSTEMKQNSIFSLFLFLIFGTGLLLAEPSSYGFNNGGSTSTRSTGSMQNSVLQNQRSINFLKRRIDVQNERIDGLTSIIEGLNITISNLKGKSVSSDGNGNMVLLKELGEMIDKINSNYVSKEELQMVLNGKNIVSPKVSDKTTMPKESWKKQSTSSLYSEAARLFAKKRYDEAQKRFMVTDTEGYKPAASNYYLGEIAYYTKKYKDAIFYFKKSAGLYDKASYIDVLLLHTAISLEKSGDKAQARIFYENIIENYQDRKSAKIAKEKLKKL